MTLDPALNCVGISRVRFLSSILRLICTVTTCFKTSNTVMKTTEDLHRIPHHEKPLKTTADALEKKSHGDAAITPYLPKQGAKEPEALETTTPKVKPFFKEP